MEFKNDVTILVNSCDKYEDAWEPFFRLFHMQWPDCPYKIILNTESKTFLCDYISVETIHTCECNTWTERVKKALSKIDTEFVLFFLEDFFLLSQVNLDYWNAALTCMKKHKSTGFMWFPPNGPIHQPSKYKSVVDKHLYENKKSRNFRINATLGLWRKEFLLQMLYRDGNAWYFEWSATKLSKYSNYKATFWDQRNVHVFDYEISPESGIGIVRGKWLPGNQKLFELHNIKVNYENLGTTSINESIKSMGAKSESNNKHLKKAKRFIRNLKRQIHDIKRFPKLYFKFKKYCETIHTELQKQLE